MCRWCATYLWKALDKSYNCAFNLISIKGLHAKLWTPKVAGVLVVRISRRPFENPRQNDIWVPVPWPSIEYTIRGKVVASLKSGSWWILWFRICPWLVEAPKVLQLCTNQLVVWFCVDPCEWLSACHSS
jgi:hypothetical protein